MDISSLDSIETLKDHISVVCFLGNNIAENKAGFFNLNEKIYKKFIDYNKFQIISTLLYRRYGLKINLVAHYGN